MVVLVIFHIKKEIWYKKGMIREAEKTKCNTKKIVVFKEI